MATSRSKKKKQKQEEVPFVLDLELYEKLSSKPSEEEVVLIALALNLLLPALPETSSNWQSLGIFEAINQKL